MSRVLGGSQGGERFLVGEDPLYDVLFPPNLEGNVTKLAQRARHAALLPIQEKHVHTILMTLTRKPRPSSSLDCLM